jgi:2-amino-4-hydroxy-6-hydroxymethyldihydropteridine diphosphokinase
MTTLTYIGLGSNLGDRRGYLEQALSLLRETPGIEVLRVSSFFETAPVGGPAGQGPYLNAAAAIRTSLPPTDLLKRLLAIESACGRVRAERFGPRTLDLDLLLYGDVVLDSADLTVPHPRLHERLFVLQPLAEIAAGAWDPGRQCMVADLLGHLQGVRPLGSVPGRELVGSRCLVTGSSSGIGRAIALELANGGADVIVHARRSRESAEEVAQRVREAGGRGEVLLADLRDPVARQALAEQAWQVWQGLDVLVNNAGADTLTGEAAHWPFERKLQELWEVDVQATVHLGRFLGRRMKERGNGVVVNLGWDQAETGMEGDSGELFATVKGAVMAFSRSLALSLAPEVRVNCLAPGWIRTAWGEKASEVWQERVRRETPLRRWGLPEDVAAAARWLVSPAARYLSGQIIRVNGGAVR